jgi:hypothetical protein
MAVAVATAQLAGTGEVVIATVGPANWDTSAQASGSGAQGILASAAVVATSTGAATLTLRIRQGGVAGTQVGASSIYTFAGAAGPLAAGALEFVDASAFGIGPTRQGLYVLTAQASAGATITPNGGVLEIETCAPVL